jgi:hypothetical protein
MADADVAAGFCTGSADICSMNGEAEPSSDEQAANDITKSTVHTLVARRMCERFRDGMVELPENVGCATPPIINPAHRVIGD